MKSLVRRKEGCHFDRWVENAMSEVEVIDQVKRKCKERDPAPSSPCGWRPLATCNSRERKRMWSKTDTKRRKQKKRPKGLQPTLSLMAVDRRSLGDQLGGEPIKKYATLYFRPKAELSGCCLYFRRLIARSDEPSDFGFRANSLANTRAALKTNFGRSRAASQKCGI